MMRAGIALCLNTDSTPYIYYSYTAISFLNNYNHAKFKKFPCLQNQEKTADVNHCVSHVGSQCFVGAVHFSFFLVEATNKLILHTPSVINKQNKELSHGITCAHLSNTHELLLTMHPSHV